MSNYCDYNDVGVLCGKTFDASSTPTSTQVTALITQCTNEIDTVLFSIGIAAQPTDTEILGMLKKYCGFGSAGVVGMTYLRNTAGMNEAAKFYYDEYKSFLKELRENPELLSVEADAESISASNQVLDGTYSEDDMEDIIIQSEDFVP